MNSLFSIREMDFVIAHRLSPQYRFSTAHFSLSQELFVKVLIWLSVRQSWQMTSGRGSLQWWKCLYLARNVTKGNNVLSQSTLMDLPAISPVPPLTRETRDTTANKAALPLITQALVTAVHPCWRHFRSPAPETQALTSDPTIESYRLSGSQTCLISCMVVMFNAKELHLKFIFYAYNTAAELNVSSGHVWCELSLVLLWCHWLSPQHDLHIDRIGYWSGVVMSWVCMFESDGPLIDNCNTLMCISVSTHKQNTHTCTHCCLLLEFLDLPHSCLEG